MTNYRRLKIQGATYFFTLVLNERENSNLLIDHFQLLKFSIHKVKLKFPFQLVAMVVLPDHLHVIVSLPKNDEDYSVRIRLIKTYFSKALGVETSLSR